MEDLSFSKGNIQLELNILAFSSITTLLTSIIRCICCIHPKAYDLVFHSRRSHVCSVHLITCAYILQEVKKFVKISMFCVHHVGTSNYC